MTSMNTKFTRVAGTSFTRILRIGKEYPTPFMPTTETYSAHGGTTFTVEVSARNVDGRRVYTCAVRYGDETILGHCATRTSLLRKLQRYCAAADALAYGLSTLSH